MRLATCIFVIGCAVGASQSCAAGGFFRRVPEVGEWARYEWSLEQKWQFDPKEPALITSIEGLMTLQCVGEEVIDEQRHLWLECRNEFTEVVQAGSEQEGWIGHWNIVKMLVPEDRIIDGGLTSENVRGWFARIEADPVPLEFSPGDSDKDRGWFTLMVVFAGSNVVTGMQEERTVVVNDEEVPLSNAEAGPLPEQKFADLNVTGEGVWWPTEEMAFGIGSAAITYVQLDPEEEDVSQNDIRYDLVATGTDAVSELPDYN